MIYLDSAATSLLKPRTVTESMIRAMRTMASPGRGGHRPAMLAADMALDCRQALAELFNVDDPEKIVFTLNATHALNIAINTLAHCGSRVLVSGYEHNSVTRPLRALGAEVAIAASPLFDPEAAAQAFWKGLPGSDLCVCCHTSNVFGFTLPLKKIAAMCQYFNVPLIVDASQSAGVVGIDFAALGAEFIAMPGHKGLMGPQGTGVLLCRNGGEPLMYGGTGSNSAQPDMPDFMPDRLEAGTHNITGIAGLYAGVQYVKKTKPENILRHERRLTRLMAARLQRTPGLRLYLSETEQEQTGVLSVIPERGTCEGLAEELGKRDVAVRSGLHCAPTAHRTAETFATGTVRFSFSPFNTEYEVTRAADIVSGIVKNL